MALGGVWGGDLVDLGPPFDPPISLFFSAGGEGVHVSDVTTLACALPLHPADGLTLRTEMAHCQLEVT